MMGASLLLWLLLVVYYPFTAVPVHMNGVVKCFSFLLGMFLVSEPELQKLPAWSGCLMLPVIGIFLFAKRTIPLPDELKSTLLATVIFCFFMKAEPRLGKCRWPDRMIGFISGFSYEAYLIHHVIIFWITGHFKGQYLPGQAIAILMIVELTVILLAGYVLRWAEDLPGRLLRKK